MIANNNTYCNPTIIVNSRSCEVWADLRSSQFSPVLYSCLQILSNLKIHHQKPMVRDLMLINISRINICILFINNALFF